MSPGLTTAFQAAIRASSCSAMVAKGRGRSILGARTEACPKWLSLVKNVLGMKPPKSTEAEPMRRSSTVSGKGGARRLS